MEIFFLVLGVAYVVAAITTTYLHYKSGYFNQFINERDR
jgi:hypothetical protein